ncbi:hypothetical protein CNR22_17880 [Sphingobacteriaceae bacterium]|nr:hypothetical protein CNR22_17880 [Sphingobacteriaceae bacterium]
MKSYIYSFIFTTFLFSFQVNAQTEKKESTQTSGTSSENKRILTRLGGKTVVDNQSAENELAVKTANLTGESDRTELLKLAEALSYQSRRLKKEAETKTGNEKVQLLAESAKFENKCLVKQIEASEIFGAMNQVRFNSNKETITKLIVSVKLEEPQMVKTRKLIFSAQNNMRLAKDLREEAYQSASLPVRLGTMSNAEEKEVLALGEQSQAISILYKKPGAGM